MLSWRETQGEKDTKREWMRGREREGGKKGGEGGGQNGEIREKIKRNKRKGSH